MESRYLGAGLIIAAFAHAGCSASHHARPAVDPTAGPGAEEPQATACEDGLRRTWDLGAGRLEDILDKAPDFYRPGDEVQNAMRSKQLARATLPPQVALNAKTVGGVRVAEFVGPASAPAQVVAFTGWRNEYPERVVMIVPEQCPHILVEENCVDGRVIASVRSEETIQCFAGRSGTFGISGPDFQPGTSISPGQPLWLEIRAGTIQVSLGVDNRSFFVTTLKPDEFGTVTPDLFFAVLEHAGGIAARKVCDRMDAKWQTAEFEDRLVAFRVAKIKTSIAGGDSASMALLAASPEDRLPGSDRVYRALQPELGQAFNEIASSGKSVAEFQRGLKYLDLLSEPSPADVDAFQNRFGSALTRSEMTGTPEAIQQAENEFLRRWPDSSGAKKITARRNQEAAVATAAAEAEARQLEAEARRAEAAEEAQCYSRCDHKCMNWHYADKALCQKGCRNYECENNFCVGACQADCSTVAKAGQPGCVQACIKGRCGQ